MLGTMLVQIRLGAAYWPGSTGAATAYSRTPTADYAGNYADAGTAGCSAGKNACSFAADAGSYYPGNNYYVRPV